MRWVSRMTQDLVGRALFQAVSLKRPAAGLIHQSDRGSQYCSLEYQRLLAQFGMLASMSRRDNCYDNAPMSSAPPPLTSRVPSAIVFTGTTSPTQPQGASSWASDSPPKRSFFLASPHRQALRSP